MRRFFAWCAICLTLCAGCSRATQSHIRAPRTNAQLIIAEPAEPSELNPILSTDLLTGYFAPVTFSYLFAIDDRNALVPDIATAAPVAGQGISADGLTFTYHLRLGVRWQDGAPLTARDAIFTYQAIMNSANNVPNRQGYDEIASIAAPDDRTVVVRLRRKYAPFVSTFLVSYPILPEHLLGRLSNLNSAPYNIKPVGSGPYSVAAWLRGDRIIYDANPRYWRGRPHIARIVLKFVPATNTIVTQLRTQEVDAWFGAASGAYAELKALPGYDVSLLWANGFGCFDLNTKDLVLRDVRVRQALALALDRAKIVRIASHGIYTVTDSDQTPLSWAYDPNGPRMRHDPVEARRLLDEAGWRLGADGIRIKNGKRLEIGLTYMAGYSTVSTIAAMTEEEEKSVGVAIAQKTYPEALLAAPSEQGGVLASGNYQIAFDFKYTPGTDPDDSYLWGCDRVPPNGLNNTFWCDRKVDAALEDALSHYDRQRRKRDYAIVQREIIAQAPVIFLYRGQSSAIYPKSLRGVVRSTSGSDFWSVWRWRFR